MIVIAPADGFISVTIGERTASDTTNGASMTSKIFSVATFTLVAWLAVTVVTTSQQLLATEHQLSLQIEDNHQLLSTRIDAIENAQQTDHNTVITHLNKQISAPPVETNSDHPELNQLKAETRLLRSAVSLQSEPIELRAAYQQILETELEKRTDAISAAEKLLATKGAIWKASTTHEVVRENLRGLMAPIDILASQWKNGDTDGSVAPVFIVLRETLDTLNAL